MNLSRMLAARAAANNPVRVGVIGAGKFGSMYLAQAIRTPGIHVLGVADLDVERAKAALDRVHWPAEQYAASGFDDARDSGRTFITDDAQALLAAGIDVMVEATGAPAVGLMHARAAFAAANDVVLAVSDATRAGTKLVFGYLGGGPLPFEEPRPGAAFVLALQALPLILVVSALTSLLTYWRILPAIVQAFAFLLRKTLGLGGAVGFGAAANIFVGMVEAPLFIRPYFAGLPRAELFVLMTTGMATIAGTDFPGRESLRNEIAMRTTARMAITEITRRGNVAGCTVWAKAAGASAMLRVIQ